MQLILRHHHSLTSWWAFHQPQHVWRNMFFQICIRSQTCSFHTREDAKNCMTGFFLKHFCNGTEFRSFCLKSFLLCCLMFLRNFSLAVSLGLRTWCGRRRSSFLPLTIAQVSLCKFVMTETTLVSFWTLSMCLPLKNTLPLSSRRRGFLSFLTFGDWPSFHNFARDCEVSLSHHLISMWFYKRFQS